MRRFDPTWQQRRLHLGSTLAKMRPNLDPLGSNLPPTCRNLALSRNLRPISPSGSNLGSSWVRDSTTWAQVGTHFAGSMQHAWNLHFTATSNVSLTGSCKAMHIGPALGPTWSPDAPTHGTKLRMLSPTCVQTCPGCAMLDPSWAQLGANWPEFGAS